MSKRIHLTAICGTGMAALAGMLKDRGYEITGSDENIYPPMSTFLESKGIPIYKGFDASHLEPAPDLVVIGNAVSRGNPEVEYVLDRQIRYASLPETLKEYFIRGKYSCVVAGTHGKTTTTSLLAWILESAGLNPNFFIGGIPENFGQGYQLSSGSHFVLEGDEYDSAFFDKGPKFLHYLPNLVILNNIEFDHADIYRSFDDIKISFQRLINLIPSIGFLIACSDDPVVRELQQKAFCKIITFGFSEVSDWRACDVAVKKNDPTADQNYYDSASRNDPTADQNYYDSASRNGTEFFVARHGERVGPFFIHLFGKHNVRNATAALAASTQLGVTFEQAQKALFTFKGIQRRLQARFEDEHVIVLDDFAHHPTEVKETLEAVRGRFPDRRIWAVFEPRTATTKRKIFEREYTQAFKAADLVVFAPLHRIDKVPANERINLDAVIDGIKAKGKRVAVLPAGREMANYLGRQIEKGDVVVFMSNGDFGGTPALLAQNLSSRSLP